LVFDTINDSHFIGCYIINLINAFHSSNSPDEYFYYGSIKNKFFTSISQIHGYTIKLCKFKKINIYTELKKTSVHNILEGNLDVVINEKTETMSLRFWWAL
jgi:hypothetical protein